MVRIGSFVILMNIIQVARMLHYRYLNVQLKIHLVKCVSVYLCLCFSVGFITYKIQTKSCIRRLKEQVGVQRAAGWDLWTD